MLTQREKRERTIEMLDPWPHKERGPFLSRVGLSALTDEAVYDLARSLTSDMLFSRRLNRENRARAAERRAVA